MVKIFLALAQRGQTGRNAVLGQ